MMVDLIAPVGGDKRYMALRILQNVDAIITLSGLVTVSPTPLQLMWRAVLHDLIVLRENVNINIRGYWHKGFRPALRKLRNACLALLVMQCPKNSKMTSTLGCGASSKIALKAACHE